MVLVILAWKILLRSRKKNHILRIFRTRYFFRESAVQSTGFGSLYCKISLLQPMIVEKTMLGKEEEDTLIAFWLDVTTAQGTDTMVSSCSAYLGRQPSHIRWVICITDDNFKLVIFKHFSVLPYAHWPMERITANNSCTTAVV